MTPYTTVSSRASRATIQQHLQNFRFKALFVEELGWNILKEPPLTITIEGTEYILQPLVEKRGVKVLVCGPNASAQIPSDRLLRKIEHAVTRLAAYEQFIIYIDAAREHQVWQWVKRERGKRAAVRINRYHRGQSGELLTQKLEHLAIRLEEEARLYMADVMERVAQAFDVERVTKKFYDRFKLEHTAFLQLIEGVQEQADREWYASLMLNRLMFVYFIQRKGFLDTREPDQLDGDPHYLSNRLKGGQKECSTDHHTFYRPFLLKLFHNGLGQRRRSPELRALLGNVPYLNGGLFDMHVLELANPEIAFPDEAFSTYSNRPGKLFAGVEQRLTVLLASIAARPAVWTTPYRHWYESEREYLFSTLVYCRTARWEQTGMPIKAGHRVAAQIFERLSQQQAVRWMLPRQSSTAGVWMHDGPTYWVRAFPFEPNRELKSSRSNHYHHIPARTPEEAAMLSALFSSSTFYLFYKMISNCRDLGPKEWLQMPFTRPQPEIEARLIECGQALARKLQATASRRTRQYASGAVVYEEYYPARARAILDDIDRILAQHNGLSEQELDFILNYDIKYRMGR